MSADWRKDKAYYKVINIEKPGKPIEIGFNGDPIYRFQDGVTALMPKAVAGALKNCKKTIHDIKGGLGKGESQSFERPRYEAILDVEKTEEWKNGGKQSEITDEMKESLEEKRLLAEAAEKEASEETISGDTIIDNDPVDAGEVVQ